MPDINIKTILPYGFHDKIFDEAENEMKLNHKILKELKNLEFRLVRPAALEFEESLDKNHSAEFFKLTDPVSGKMMVLRKDITPQIARIIRDKFAGENFAKNILKISYSGQVFLKNPKLISTERQVTQTGFEYVDNKDFKNDVEAIQNVTSILSKVKFKNYTINFVYPNFLNSYLKDDNKLEEIQKSIEVKDYSELKKLDSKLYEIANISDEIYDFASAEKALEKITKIIVKNKKLSEEVKEIKNIIFALKKQVNNINITFDILENNGFSYHQGLCYSVIANNNFEEIGRGGRYIIDTKDKNINAVGFTFTINSILRSLVK